MEVIYENKLIRVEVEEAEVPWLKIFLQEPYEVLLETPQKVKAEALRVLDIISQEMIANYNPDKINILSFGSALPNLYWHVIARFKNDSYFPEPMLGEKQREGEYKLENLKSFLARIKERL